MTNTTKTVLGIIVLVLIIWGVSALVKSPESNTIGPIKIGFIGPLAGDLANMGKNAQAAVQIASDEINATGGILGRQIEVVYEDDQCAGAQAANAISKLINTDKVVAVLGGACSGATLAAAPIAEQNKIPELSYCSTNPTISKAGDYIFRNVPSDFFQANFAAKFLVDKGMKNVALLYTKDDYGQGLDNAFKDALTKTGGTLVAEESFDPTSKDLRPQLLKIKVAKPQALYFIGYTAPTIAGLKQAKELGLTVPALGADAWDDTKIWSELGTLGEGAMYTVVGTNSSNEFKQKMMAKLGAPDLIYCSNYAYDGLNILAEAINKAGSSEGSKIKDALYKIDYKGGVSSEEIKFDVNGDPTSANYSVKVIKNGKATDMK